MRGSEKTKGEKTMLSNNQECPNENIRITPKDVFANYSDDDLRLLRDAMTDLAVMVDKYPELEKRYETFGADYETMKQDIDCELKRRSMES